MSLWPEDVTLSGEHVVLAALSQAHASDLAEAATDGDLHKLWYTMIPHADDVPAEIDGVRCVISRTLLFS